MKDSGMIIPKRVVDPTLISNLFFNQENDSLRKYFDFFVQMEYKEVPLKIPYLLKNK